MAIALESNTDRFDQTGVGGETLVDFPATRPDGDLYMPLIGGDGNGLITTLNGYTAIYNEDVGLSAGGIVGLLYKIGSSEPAQYDFDRDEGTENYNTTCLRFSGVDSTTPIGAQTAAGAYNSGTGTTSTAPAITATDGDSLILRIHAGDDEFSAISATEITRSVDPGGAGTVNFACSYEASPGNGVSTGTSTATINSSVLWAAYTVEIMPAAGGTVVPIFLNHYNAMRNK